MKTQHKPICIKVFTGNPRKPALVKKHILILKYHGIFPDMWLANQYMVGISLLHSAN